MFVKVCGMRQPDNIRAVEQLHQVNAQGFIFAPRSPRFVSTKPTYLPQRCQRIGVFVNATEPDILSKVNSYALHAVQLHGHETPQFCHLLRSLLPSTVQIWKALPICEAADFDLTQPYENHVDLFLLETKATPRHTEKSTSQSPLSQLTGGTGKQFDWTLLQHYHSHQPFLLSGGISPNDAARIKKLSNPHLLGIDLNSRFEDSPAVKNIQILKQFLSELL